MILDILSAGGLGVIVVGSFKRHPVNWNGNGNILLSLFQVAVGMYVAVGISSLLLRLTADRGRAAPVAAVVGYGFWVVALVLLFYWKQLARWHMERRVEKLRRRSGMVAMFPLRPDADGTP